MANMTALGAVDCRFESCHPEGYSLKFSRPWLFFFGFFLGGGGRLIPVSQRNNFLFLLHSFSRVY